MISNTITRKSLAEEVATRLQQQISRGKYKAHQQLPIEPELMKSFGVGRSTIREAIKLLVNTGLLRVQQGVGTFVQDPSGIQEPLNQRLKRAETENVNEVRQLMEMKIAELAARFRTSDDIATLEELLEKRNRAARTGMLEECVEADVNFHVALAVASKNDLLADLYTSFATHLKTFFFQLYPDTEIFKETVHLHQQLMESIVQQDARKAWHWAARITGHSIH